MSDILEPIQALAYPRPSESNENLFELTTNKPGVLNTIKRNGSVARYDEDKIKVAITKAYIAVEGRHAATSNRIHEQIDEITQHLTETFKRRMPSGGTIHIEDIQDQVELALMRKSQHKVAVAYVLYREERRRARDVELKQKTTDDKTMQITMPDGSLQPLNMDRVNTIVEEACRGLAEVHAAPVIKDAMRNLYHLAKLEDVHKALIMSARALVETEPNYTYVSARLLLDSMRAEALNKLGIQQEATFDEMTALYPPYFKAYVAHGIAHGMLDPKFGEFDLDQL
ncbi:MAG TPA: ribonucleoside-diphosphate reductase subunit alpha, partial [Legionella sp.]|nr:ribonucleoside-diphosphate reductase subunit alpha [Legionella sp.]